MADKKISQLTAITAPIAGTDVLPIVQSSTTKKITVAQLVPGLGSFTAPSGNVKGLVWTDGTVLANDATVTDVGYDTSTNTVQAKNLTVASTATITNGNLVIGTSGKGIDFSATAGTGTSELLADYEEGVWTPTVTAGSGSITSYISAGKYTKIGRQVTLTWYVGISDNGTGAGYIQVTGAPYSALVANTAAYLYNQSNGKAGSGAIVGTTLYMTDYAGAYPVATGQTINGAITYFV